MQLDVFIKDERWWKMRIWKKFRTNRAKRIHDRYIPFYYRSRVHLLFYIRVNWFRQYAIHNFSVRKIRGISRTISSRERNQFDDTIVRISKPAINCGPVDGLHIYNYEIAGKKSGRLRIFSLYAFRLLESQLKYTRYAIRDHKSAFGVEINIFLVIWDFFFFKMNIDSK